MSNEPNDDLYIDANGRPAERVLVGGQEVIVVYDEIPESDITIVEGLRCTTPLRTVIDLAVELQPEELTRIVRECLDRRLFSPREAAQRAAQPDMQSHRGVQLLLAVIKDLCGEA